MMKYFHDTEVQIESVKNAGSYSKDTEYERICTVMADVQPYKYAGSQEQYGIFKNVCLVMYCNECEILAGMRAVIDGQRYIVSGVEKRRLGMKVYLKEEAI